MLSDIPDFVPHCGRSVTRAHNDGITLAARAAMLDEFMHSDAPQAIGVCAARITCEPYHGKRLKVCMRPAFNSYNKVSRAVAILCAAAGLSPKKASTISRCLDHGRIYVTATLICTD